MLIVGLTGGIASGKSTASEYIKKTLKIPVIDADVIARDVVRVGQPAYREIVKTFGAEVVREDNGGQLDREKLGKLIFANTALKSKLNSITHPKIRWEILKQVLYYYVRANDIVVLDIPLLFESGLNRFTHSNVLIYAEDDVQLERLIKRNPELTREDAQNRITAQMPMKKKVDLADHVVMNDGSIEDLHDRIDEIFSNKLKTSRWKTWLFLAMPLLMVFSIAMNQISGWRRVVVHHHQFERDPLNPFGIIPQPQDSLLIGGYAHFPLSVLSDLENVLTCYQCNIVDVLERNKFIQVEMTSNRQQDISLSSEEAYSLDISLTRVEINAVHQKGLIHALQSLRQILQSSRQLNIFQMVHSQILVGRIRSVFDIITQMSLRWKYFEVPCGIIHDNPQYEWRGMLLDCSRHFMSKELIIQVLHLMSYHKLNVFHWHLVDDQGWRLESQQFPLLNKIGSYRKQEDGSIYGGYYTKQDVADIVQVARHLHIRVVPEIELPGHSMAALAAYPQYSCSGSKVEVPHTWGVFEHVYCAGNDDTLDFLTKVFEEALEMFGDYVSHVHIGGDECPKSQWRQCDKCKKRVTDNNLQNFEQLQSWFITQMVNRLEKFNKTIIGWDEILEGDQLPQCVVVQSWRGYDQLHHALQRGHKSLISPTSHVYFDYPLTVTDIRKVYSFQPIPEGLDQKYHHLILGSEACMWTERAPEHLVLQKIFPRLSAFAFVMWMSPQFKPTFPKFHLLLISVHLQRVKVMGVDGIGDGLAVRPKMRYNCIVGSTMGRHGNYFEEFALDGDAATYYWSNQNVQAGDTFEVIFKSHLPNVDQISVVTGLPMERHRDFLWDGDLQVKFDKQSPWVTVGHFHDGQAQGQLQGKSITGVRIVGKRNQNSWLVIRAIDIQ